MKQIAITVGLLLVLVGSANAYAGIPFFKTKSDKIVVLLNDSECVASENEGDWKRDAADDLHYYKNVFTANISYSTEVNKKIVSIKENKIRTQARFSNSKDYPSTDESDHFIDIVTTTSQSIKFVLNDLTVTPMTPDAGTQWIADGLLNHNNFYDTNFYYVRVECLNGSKCIDWSKSVRKYKQRVRENEPETDETEEWSEPKTSVDFCFTSLHKARELVELVKK